MSTEDTFTARKLSLLDHANVDPRLTDMDYRILAYIASAVDRTTEVARRKQQVIADAMGKTRRGVQLSISRLSKSGYLHLETKDGGSYVNAYRLMLEKANTGSSFEHRKTNTASPFEQVKTNTGSPFQPKRRTETHKKANRDAQKGEPSFAHDPFISLEIPTAREPAIARALGSLADDLAAKIGRGHFHSWFRDAAVTDVAGDTLTLSVPTRLTAERVRFDYGPAVLGCCTALVPSIKHIRVVVAARAGAAA